MRKAGRQEEGSKEDVQGNWEEARVMDEMEEGKNRGNWIRKRCRKSKKEDEVQRKGEEESKVDEM